MIQLPKLIPNTNFRIELKHVGRSHRAFSNLRNNFQKKKAEKANKGEKKMQK